MLKHLESFVIFIEYEYIADFACFVTANQKKTEKFKILYQTYCDLVSSYYLLAT